MKFGIDGVNKNIKSGLVGIGGVNKVLKEVYTGIDGVNKLVWSAVVPFNPVDISNCVLWSDAETLTGVNNSPVSMLEDLVGGNNFITNGNTLLNTDGIKSIKFSSSSLDTQNNIGVSGNSARTIIVLAKPYSNGNLFGYGNVSPLLMVDGLLISLKFAIHAYGAGADNVSIAPPFSLNATQAFTIWFDGVKVKTGVNRNFSSEMSMALNTVNKPFKIGAGTLASFNNWSGEIMEVIIFNRALNNEELNTLYDYLGSKRGLTL